MSYMEKVIQEFILESLENLDQLDRDLVALEEDPNSKEIVDRVFRIIHTLKGSCVFLGYTKLESLSHSGENLLSLVRDGELKYDRNIADALLAFVDAVREMVENIEKNGEEGDGDYSILVNTFMVLGDTTLTCAPEEEEPAKAQAPVAENEAVAEEAEATEIQEEVQEATEPEPVEPEAVVVEASEEKKEEKAPVKSDSSGSVADSTIRVDVMVLDKLMNLVGELVLTRNQILQFSNADQDDMEMVNASQRLNLLTTELQERVMKTRMQPMSTIWNKFPRVVRDLAKQCGKQIRVEMEGKETELDKTLIEAIKDPLTHIIRNSADHGIEDPQTRESRGKNPEGVLLLKAYHEGGQVVIEITDDGGGINEEKVLEKAVSKGILTADKAAALKGRDIWNLIFAPGFSTAEQITNVSGRGVGMDVVKSNIEKLGGTVELHSVFQQGTTLKIKIPLTLAIIPALIVSCQNDRFAIPQISLYELLRLEGDSIHELIETVHGAPVYRLRGELLPLVFLDQVIGVEKPRNFINDSWTNGLEKLNIVVLHADEQSFGLVVDEVRDSEEIVVKPLSKQLRNIETFAGATIMGDGKVALILDVMGLANKSGVLSDTKNADETDSTSEIESVVTDTDSLLIIQSGDDRRQVIPLSTVARLEEFPVSMVEKAGSQELVQYRGQIMPLINLSSMVSSGYYSSSEKEDDDMLQVVVYTKGEQSVGLVVEKIVDIVDQKLVVERESHQTGILGTAVVQNKATDVLDMDSIISMACPDIE